LSPDEVHLGIREPAADVARVLSRYVDCLLARVFGHEDVESLAAHSTVPVINGLSEYCHPVQAIGDLLTILESKSVLRGLKLAWVGDGNNVLTSVLFGATKVGMDVAVATPQGYEPSAQVMELAFGFARENSCAVELCADPMQAVHGADVIYTDVWTSMGHEAERERRNAVFPPYQVNARLIDSAEKDVVVMHCLPAHRGEEITDGVIEGAHSIVFDQAENRLHSEKGILAVLLANR
jgi:ornithine carbamoyltransferase